MLLSLVVHLDTAHIQRKNMSNLSESAHEILRDAVNVARDFQCQSLAALKSRLAMRWPGQESEVAEAIKFWANRVREGNPGGVSRI